MVTLVGSLEWLCSVVACTYLVTCFMLVWKEHTTSLSQGKRDDKNCFSKGLHRLLSLPQVYIEFIWFVFHTKTCRRFFLQSLCSLDRWMVQPHHSYQLKVHGNDEFWIHSLGFLNFTSWKCMKLRDSTLTGNRGVFLFPQKFWSLKQRNPMDSNLKIP